MKDEPWVTTFSGRQFFITHATSSDIYIEDIAHGLSNICRYVGQCKTFYSVAEHSVRMAEILIKRGMSSRALLALLHDSPEAYVNDLNTTVKKLLPVYVKVEADLLNTILDTYHVRRDDTLMDREIVKDLDTMIRTPEVLSLFSAHEGWNLKPFSYSYIRPWSSKKAEKKFLKMFRRLYTREQRSS